MFVSNTTKVIISTIVVFCIGVIIFYTNKPAVGLDNFVTLTQQDPLFYSPYFDEVAFTEAVKELEMSEEKLKETALHNISLSKESYTKPYTDLIQNTPLFPTNFLLLLPEISSKTEDFNTQPTKQKAYHLLSLYEQAQKAYEKDAKLMTTAFEKIDGYIPDDKPVFYFFINSATSIELTQNNFDLIYKNSLALKDEIKRRKKCLSTNTNCEINQETTPLIISAEIISNNYNLNFIKETLPFASTTREIKGPYNVNTTCWGSNKTNPMYAIYSTNEKGQKIILPKLVDENYYNIVSPKATDLISQKIRELGLQFYGQAEGTTYECSDLNFYPNILAQDFISSNDISTSTDNLIFTHFINNKFGVLAPALQSLASFTNLLETSQRISTDFVLSPQFLFATRSAYSLTYLPFANSVWRIEEEPKYLLTQEEFLKMGAPTQFKSLTELKQEGYTEDQIKESQINQKEFIESLVE